MTPPAPTTGEWLRDAARRISRGVPILAGRLLKRGTKVACGHGSRLRTGVRGWLGESTGLVDTAVRWVILAGAGWGAWTVARLVLEIGGHAVAGARWLMWPGTAVLVVAAYRAGGPAAATPGPETTSGPVPVAAPTGTQLIVPRDRFITALHTAIGAGRAVHLAYLAERFAEDYPEQAWDVPAVAALCAAYGIPVSPKKRAHGRGATRAVVREAIPPLAKATPAGLVADVDVAGQEPSTEASTSTSTGPSTVTTVGGGEGFVTVPDDVNPARTWVRWTGRKTA